MESLLDILCSQEYHKIRKGKRTFHSSKQADCEIKDAALSAGMCLTKKGAMFESDYTKAIAQHTDHDIPFDRLQQQLEVIPSECDKQDQNQYRPDNRHG